jgi:hypothetical protein
MLISLAIRVAWALQPQTGFVRQLRILAFGYIGGSVRRLKMTKSKLIPILVVLILVFIASQFNAFGSLANLTGKIIFTIKNTIINVSKIFVVEKDQNTTKVAEIKSEEQPSVPAMPEKTTSAPIVENMKNSVKEKKLENDDWEYGINFENFFYDTNDDFYQEPEYDYEKVEETDDWDALLESLRIEIFSLSGEDYAEYLDLNDKEEIESLPSTDELPTLEEWLDIDEEKLKEMEDSIDEFTEMMDEFYYIPNQIK